MQQRPVMVAGGLGFIVGALAFVSVFTYLATNFDYPGVLDGTAAEVLPRLRAGGSMMRAVWALYAFLPLLLVPGAVGTLAACPSSSGRMVLALVAASLGALAMCLGLMRWPSIHWALAEAYAQSGAETQNSLSAVFLGLNLYLGNYVGEFLGELCLSSYFLLTGLSLVKESRFPNWLGWRRGVRRSLLDRSVSERFTNRAARCRHEQWPAAVVDDRPRSVTDVVLAGIPVRGDAQSLARADGLKADEMMVRDRSLGACRTRGPR